MGEAEGTQDFNTTRRRCLTTHCVRGCLDFTGRLVTPSCDRPLQSLLRTSFVYVRVCVQSGGSLQAMKAMKAMKAARLPT